MMRPWSRIFGLCITLVFLSIPLASAQLNAEIVASREECVAPCAIFFEGTESTDSNGYYIGDSTTTADLNSRGLLGNDILEYTWEFGDGTNFSGFNAAHVYETPNTYTVRLTVRDVNNDTAEITQVIDVQAFNGETYCFSNDGDFSGCPISCPSANCVQTDKWSGDAGVDVLDYRGSNRRLLLHEGHTFTYASSAIIGASNMIIAAFGDIESGARPVIQYAGTEGGEDWAPIRAVYANAVSVVDLDFQLESTVNLSRPDAFNVFGAHDILALRCTFEGYHASGGYADGLFVVDSQLINAQLVNMYYHGSRLAILNSELGPAETSHNLYGDRINRGVISNSYFHEPSTDGGGRVCLRIAANLATSRNVVVSDNEFDGTTTWLAVQFAITSGSWDETQHCENLLFERNIVKAASIALMASGDYLNTVVRNNIFDKQRASQEGSVFQIRQSVHAPSGPIGFHFYNNIVKNPGLGPVISINEPINQDVKIFNNIIYGTSTSSAAGAIHVDYADAMNGITSNNNLYYFPNKPDGDNPDLVEIFQVGNWPDDIHYTLSGWQDAFGEEMDSIIDNPSFVTDSPVNPEDFKLNSSSPAIDNGISLLSVFEDYDGNARPVDGDNNGSAEWDIGAFEYQGGAGECTNDAQCNDANPCTGDVCESGSCRYINYNLDGSETIGLGDIIQVIAYWGGSNPDADLDENGNVSLSDIIVLIGVWGTYC